MPTHVSIQPEPLLDPRGAFRRKAAGLAARPSSLIVIVCGGPGTFSMVAVPWGLSQAVSRPVQFRDGTPLLTLKGRSAIRRG